MRLLLLEDDGGLAAGIKAYLEVEGHTVDVCQRLLEARSLLTEDYDAYLVDWQLPDGSGLDWVSQLRRSGSTVPVIILTARDLIADRVKGLDSGADDYLVKPFDPEELAARLRAITRRAVGLSGPRVRIGSIEIDFSGRTVLVAGMVAPLTLREWSLLEALARRSGRLVAKADLESMIYGLESDIASNSIEVHISSLRRKLGRDLIETVRGMGYRIVSR